MNILLLGASGSIGSQTLDILKKDKDHFKLVAFSVGHNSRCITSILKQFKEVKHIYLISKRSYKYYQNKYQNIKFYYGKNGLSELVKETDYDMMVNALVGFCGLEPTLIALNNDKKVALANKESLVVGGEIINDILKQGKGTIYPIDSEHGALYKCLKVDDKNVSQLIITASGGAFRKLNREQLKDVKPSDALNHPTWRMGSKITIDCASMMNKCFEVVEAYYLFNYPFNKIKVIQHDESYVHSMVKYKNGLFRAEISKPDMHNPIEFAIYEGEIPFTTYTFNSLDKLKDLHFHPLDYERYPLMKHAEKLIKKRGAYGAILNAVNEEAVYAFLKGKISFLDIEKIIDQVMSSSKIYKKVDYLKIKQIDKKTRQKANKLIKNMENINK